MTDRELLELAAKASGGEMTRDEIAQFMQDTIGAHWGDEAHFQRFAKRIAAAEREAIAKNLAAQDSGSTREGISLEARKAIAKAEGKKNENHLKQNPKA